jgi:hypothetical protein
MIRYDCFEWLVPQMTDQLVVTSLSGQRWNQTARGIAFHWEVTE